MSEMKNYNSISRGLSRTNKEYYERTPVQNGSMSAQVVTISWWLGLGLLTVGAVVSYNHLGSSTSDYSSDSPSNLIQKLMPRSFTSSSSSSSSSTSVSGVIPSYRLRRVGYSTMDLSHNILKYKFLAEMSDVIEPYAPMELVVDEVTDSSLYYTFDICKSDSSSTDSCVSGVAAPSGSSLTSQSATVSCAPFETYTVTVNQIDASSGETLASTSSQAKCMYVRRELRTLTPDDLDKAMDALYTVYTVGDDEGQALYGENYHDYTYALHFHHFNAAWRESDHIHEGNGFAPQHIKMTNLVEASMQMVDPSVALPYWDFTIDHANNHVSFSSDVFTESMFGGMTRPTDLFKGFLWANDSITDGKIPNGRWAGLTAEMNTIYPELRNGFGYMRAPWNMNPSPYVSRFAAEYQIGVQLPSCNQHYDLLSYTKRMEFLYDIQNGPHATTHALTGGTYGCDVLYPMLERGLISDEESLKYICSTWVFSLKEFYRYNYITPYKDCVVADDIESSVCGFTCTTDEKESKQFKMNMQQKLSKYVPSNMNDEGWLAWKSFICEGDGWKIFSGDHLESASPADPSFWSIHPTLERLMQAKSMAGGFVEQTGDWVVDSKDSAVCDKSECYMEDYGERGVYEDCCRGHYENDATLDFVAGDKSAQWGATNREVLDATNPTLETYSMPYIYDSFTWSHCDNDFETLIYNLHEGIAVEEVDASQSLVPEVGSISSDGTGTSSSISSSGPSSVAASASTPGQVLTGVPSGPSGPNAVVPGAGGAVHSIGSTSGISSGPAGLGPSSASGLTPNLRRE